MENNIINNYDLYTCPSFSSYSQTATQVATEINKNNDEEEEFEFSILHDENEHVVYPVFNKDLTLTDELETVAIKLYDDDEESVVVSLETLFLQDRLNDDEIQSCSSSEADELDDIPPETYCVWRPKATESPTATPSCKKSKSTGSASKRWKIRDFMRRSNSDGKDSFVFLTPHENKKSYKDKDTFDILAQPKQKQSVRKSGKMETKWSPSAHEALYVQNRAAKEENRRKSYLPYKRDLVGFFSNVNVLGKGVPHF